MQSTSRASSTALLIAASLVLQDERGVALHWIPATTIALSRGALQSAGWPWRAVGKAVRFAAVRAGVERLERWALPGIQAHYLMRKQRISGWAEEALTLGYRQILVLGAGFDGLAADLAGRHPDLHAIEWDHPATQALKREALNKAGLARSSLRLHAMDLARADPVAALVNTELERNRPTLIVAEGLLMYLPLQRCRQLLGALTAWFHGPLRIAFSYMEHDSLGEPGFTNAHPSVKRWLQRRGEPFLWACRYDVLVPTLEHQRFRLLASNDGATAPAQPLPDWAACPGETLCLIEAMRQT